MQYLTKKVYTVNDLKTVNQFSLFESNRDLVEQHVKNIMVALRKGENVGIALIELRTDKIIDGQHRIEAVKRLLENGENASIDVVFKDFGGDEKSAMDFAHDLNCYQKGWTDKNYLAYYKPQNDDYKRLEDFAKAHSLCYSIVKTGPNKGGKNLKLTTAARLVMGLAFKRDAIRKGTFQATDEEFEEASQYHDEIKRMLEIKGYVNEEKTCPNIGNSFESFITGWIIFRTKTYRQMEKIGGFDAYCLRVPNLDMSVCTNVQEWYRRFSNLLNP